MNRCGTIGCNADATHTLAFTFQGSRDRVETDLVCKPCGEAFTRRPSLSAVIVPGLVTFTLAEYMSAVRKASLARTRMALETHAEHFRALVS